MLSNVDHRRVLRAGALVLLAVLVVPVAVAAVPQLALADRSYVVMSGSMQPHLQPGDVVLVKEVSPAEIDRGDVITYQRPGEQPTTHRVVEVQDRGGLRFFETKGDANEDPDSEPVPSGAVVGREAFHVPYVGYLVSFANTRLGAVVLMIVPAVLIVGFELWSLVGAVLDGADGETDPPEGSA